MTEVGERLRAALAADPGAPCLEFAGTWQSWADVATAAADLDGALCNAGIAPGTAVGVVMRNHPATVAAIVGALTTARPILAFRSYLPPDALAAEIDARRPGPMVVDAGAGLIVGAGAAVRLPGVAVEMLTSGTTGPPKRVQLADATLAHVLGGSDRSASSHPPSGVRIVWAPLAHIAGLWGVLQSLVEGRRVSLMERFEVEGWVERVRRYRPTLTGLPPAGLRMLLDHGVDPAHLACLRAITTGTAPAPAELVEEFQARYGVPVLVTYGATEFAGAIASWTLDDYERIGAQKRGSVGRPHPGVELRVVDPASGGGLRAGAIGVLEARGAQLGDEWVRTSDLARLDGDGYLYIEGRADDVIVRGGFKVSAGAVARVLEQHPRIAAAAVVGVPDRRLGAVPVAAVELRNADVPDPTELDAFLRERVPAYQVPAAIHVVDRLPRTPSLKIDAVAVRELVAPSAHERLRALD